jgi:hypothetical protein
MQAFTRLWPNAPKWFGGVGVATGLAAAAADFAANKRASRKPPDDTVESKLAQFYNDKANQMTGQTVSSAAPGVNVTVNLTNPGHPQVQTQTSKYMMEEGNSDIKTDCFSCASAHLAALKASTERAKSEIYKSGGQCGTDCQEWLSLGVKESAALLAKDWTSDRINQLPEHQKNVIETYRSKVRDVMSDMLGGSKQAQALVEADGLLGEAIRFTNAGDGIDHPEVFSRLAEAEANLSAAERLDITAYDPDTANRLRSLRQAVGNKVDSPDALKNVYKQTRDLTDSFNKQVLGNVTPQQIDELSNRTSQIFSGFKRDRMRVS